MPIVPVTRRQVLANGAAFTSWAYATKFASAANAPDPRFVFINLRGGMDGLSLLAPVGDPAYGRIREGLAIPTSGQNKGVQLDDTFVLNPNMPNLAKLWMNKQAILFHAVASPYRDRSHFDGQDVLESGYPSVGAGNTGWLNRLIGELPIGESVPAPKGLVVGATTPLVMTGPNTVINWINAGFREAEPGLIQHLLDLYNHTDPGLAKAFNEGLTLRGIAGGEASFQDDIKGSMGAPANNAARRFKYLGVAAGKLLAKDDGPRIANLNLPGWDTHQREGPIKGRFGKLLNALDAAIGGMHDELGDAWQQTVVIIGTEFGRTVKMNGTRGTDHGIATTAIAIGGALNGGRVIADWPGLDEAALYEGRDLKPTMDIRAVLKGLVRDHLGVSDRVLAEAVFPSSQDVKALDGLLG